MTRQKNKIPRRLQGKPCFAFVVDGQCEYWYIQMLRQHEKGMGIDLKPELPVKESLQKQYERVIGLAENEEYNKIFWILDLDVILKESEETPKGKEKATGTLEKLCKAITIAYPTKVVIIMNTPCLEFWYLLHYQQTTRYYPSCEQLWAPLQKHLPGYEKTEKFYKRQGRDIYQLLRPNLESALANAQITGAFDFQNPKKGLSEMHRLFQLLPLPFRMDSPNGL